MTHELRKLREEYVSLSERIEALYRAINARRDMAKEMAIELEEAALRGDDEKVRNLIEDLKALDLAFRQDKNVCSSLLDEQGKVERRIWNFYDKALAEDGIAVDWSITLEEGVLYHGWTGERYEGKIALIEGVELCRPELAWLREKIFQHCIVRQRGKRLQVEVPVYRDSVWADMKGEEIVRRLLPLLPRSKELQEIHCFLRELRVLR